MLEAIVTRTDIPGLLDVRLSDGREFPDLTMNQFKALSLRENWTVKFQA